MDLKQYEQWKFAFAEIIRSARAIDPNDVTLSSECVPLLARLAEDKFNLMVVGRFSRGKSTLMNAVLGSDLLPTGILPLTSVITTVRYGTQKQVLLNFSDHGMRREVPLSALPEYVTERGNPGNRKKLSYAEVELPVEILRRGFFFIDTPGLGSSIAENTLTTERFLPEADAFVLVTSFESPLTEDEDRILKRIRSTKKKLFVVVNKQDTVTPEERAEAIEFVKHQLKSYSLTEEPLVFSVSARQALDAKVSRQTEHRPESGLPAFEQELFRFLTEERAQAFLSNMCERTLVLLSGRMRSETQPQNAQILRSLMDRLLDLRGAISGTSAKDRNSAPEAEEPDAAGLPLLQVDKKTGCSICGSILDKIVKFLSQYQYALTIDPEAQREHAARGGFCPLHTWQYEAIASPYGVCAAYPSLTHRVAKELRLSARETSSPTPLHETIANLLPSRATCRMCEELTTAEQRAIAELAGVARRRDSATTDRVPASCLHHLAMVVEVLGDGETARQLVASQAALLERTAEDLQRYAIKFEGLRRYLASAEERQSALLAITLLSGHRNVTIPWVVESVI